MVGVRICKKPRQEASAQKVAPFASLLTVAVKRSALRILQVESHSGRPSRHPPVKCPLLADSRHQYTSAFDPLRTFASL